MGGDAGLLRDLRQRRADEREVGPRIFHAGHPIDGDPPRWPSLYPDIPRIAHRG